MLYESPADPELAPTPREAYLRTMLGALEMLRTGTTSVQDDAFLMPTPTPEVIDAVMQAYADSGIRATVALDQPELPDTEKLPFLDAVHADPAAAFGAPAPASAPELLAAYDHLVARGTAPPAVDSPPPCRSPPRNGSAPSTGRARRPEPRATTCRSSRTCWRPARSGALSAPDSGQERFVGRSLVRYAADLGSSTTGERHPRRVGRRRRPRPHRRGRGGRGAQPGEQPPARAAASCRSGRCATAASRWPSGVDEAICDDTVNTWGVVKQTGLVHNVSGLDPDAWPTPAEVLDALWEGGAAAMRRTGRIGRVTVGAQADLALVDLHAPAFTPFNDCAASSCTASPAGASA